MDKEKKKTKLLGELMRDRRELVLGKEVFDKTIKVPFNPILPVRYKQTLHILECKKITYQVDGDIIWEREDETATIKIPEGVGAIVFEGKCLVVASCAKKLVEGA